MLDRNWRVFLFGGVCRDLLVAPPGSRPRDIDLVIEHASIDDIFGSLQPYVKRRTRYGGLHLEVSGLVCDVWPVSDTWAFRQFPDRFRSVVDLPRTTFFNVEGVVAEIETSDLTCGSIYEYSFYAGIRSMVLDVNFPENPFPALCIIRALHTAAKTGFMIGNRLGAFLERSLQSIKLSEVVDAQESHYGYSCLGEEEIESWWQHVVRRYRVNNTDQIRLPISEKRRRELWEYDEVAAVDP
jgi:hypothetical protein